MNPAFSGELWRITGSNFVAGLVASQDGSVVWVAPILRRWFGSANITYIRSECARRNLQLEKVDGSQNG